MHVFSKSRGGGNTNAAEDQALPNHSQRTFSRPVTWISRNDMKISQVLRSFKVKWTDGNGERAQSQNDKTDGRG